MVKSEDVAFLDPTAPKHVTLDDAAQQGRVMIVGDIHGCADEFRELLERYGAAGDRARGIDVEVLTPKLSVATLRAGFKPRLHATATNPKI